MDALIFEKNSFQIRNIPSPSAETESQTHICTIVSILQHQGWNQVLLLLCRDAGTGVHDGDTASLPFERGGATGTQVPLHNSVIRKFTIYQDRLETN